VAGDYVDGSASTVFRLAGRTSARQEPCPRQSRHVGSGGAGEEQGCGGERSAKASGVSGSGGENAGVVDLSSEEPNMNCARNCVAWNYWRALDSSVQQLEFHGHYSKYRWEILSSPRTVRLLTLTSGLVSWAMMVSEPDRLCWELGQRLSFYFGC
jgi:hypothetical protein